MKIVSRTSGDIASWLASSSQLDELRVSEKHEGWRWISGTMPAKSDECKYSDQTNEDSDETEEDSDELPEQAGMLFNRHPK